MDYGLWNGIGITALAIFGLWAFFKGEQVIAKLRNHKADKQDSRK